MSSEAGRREARIVTTVCSVIAASCAASAMSPTVEAFLNRWVGIPIAAAAGLVVVVAAGRSVWSWVLDRREANRRA